MPEPKVVVTRLDSLQDDSKNANQGTERGQYMLEKSYEEAGAGRGILVDRNGKLIAGNKSRATAILAGIENAIVVQTDGTELVVTQRTDLDLDDPDPNNPARRLAYWDNRTSEVGLEWDPDQIRADLEAGLNLATMFGEGELSLFLDPPSLDDLADKYGEPDPRAAWPYIRIQVSPETHELYESLMSQAAGEDNAAKLDRILSAVQVPDIVDPLDETEDERVLTA